MADIDVVDAHAAAAEEGPQPVGVDPVLAALAAVPDASAQRVAEVSRRLHELQNERRRAVDQQRQEDRKRQRILDRLRGVSDEDVLGILAQRLAGPKAKAKPKAKPKAKGKGKAKAKAKPKAAAYAEGAEDLFEDEEGADASGVEHDDGVAEDHNEDDEGADASGVDGVAAEGGADDDEREGLFS
jgi:hypothetical protein